MKLAKGNKSTTRELVLQTIKQLHQVTVETLAEEVNVSPVTVRHHLNSLQGDGLLEIETVRQKVGRPFYVYRLTAKGHELFPQKYVRLSRRLLDQLKIRFPEDVVVDLLKSVVQQIVAEHEEELTDYSFEERLSFLMRLLAEEGFLADWKAIGTSYQLTEYSCPYQSVGETHHEICTFDTELIKGILQLEKIEQHSCLLEGDSCCQFTINPKEILINY